MSSLLRSILGWSKSDEQSISQVDYPPTTFLTPTVASTATHAGPLKTAPWRNLRPTRACAAFALEESGISSPPKMPSNSSTRCLLTPDLFEWADRLKTKYGIAQPFADEELA